MTGSLPEVDAGLLNGLREGDEAAFAAIYRLCAPAIYHRLLRLLKDVAVTEEILQDVFLKLWLHRARIEPERGFRTYLYRMADNRAIDVFRKISRDKDLQEELWASNNGFDVQADEQFSTEEDYQLVAEAINRLPPKRRQILIFCKLEEKSYQEVADLMGISVSTVSNQLVTAIKEIKLYVNRSARSHSSAVILFMSVFQDV
ncbi:RNA polymerase sigma factor [Dyadobacter aurulentus]|uniref:RNA polymerase sigma factor n=1 Tax=Dyadobacter sp. UC 10 TaxID=2605428 RepID=UPI0011F26D0C|nr:sigma-70 family RNA polymerase sigma factor [Dyadobacter sp. UC 10]KAA0992091.1 sigma-70 family RNA polymerase sigma factor [Dyadobacter sp. UC 10]